MRESDFELLMPNDVKWHLLPCISDPCESSARMTSFFIMTTGTKYAFENVETVKTFRDDTNVRIKIWFEREAQDAQS